MNLQPGLWQCFYYMPSWCQWRISVGVKARVVNWYSISGSR